MVPADLSARVSRSASDWICLECEEGSAFDET